MKKIIIVFVCIFLTSCATFSASSSQYSAACSYAKKGDLESAFMRLKSLLFNYPDSPYAAKASFAMAEYYLERGDSFDATMSFHKYINEFPEDEGVVFAELLIYKMATQISPNKNIPFNEKYFLSSIRKKMFNKPVFFIFTQNKESFSYRSALNNVYSAYDYVDKIKIMRNQEVIFELSP